MKAIVLVPFRAKHDHKVTYAPGEVKEFDNDRAVALAARGLVKLLEETPVETGTDSANVTSGKNGDSKASGKGKGKGKGKSSKKDKEAPVEAAPETESVKDNPNPDDAQSADETAESENESETENDSKDNE